MLYNGFSGPSNPSQSLLANCERTVNWYPERVEAEAAPTGAALYPTPGSALLLSVSDLEPRALAIADGRTFAVIGLGFYELTSATVAVLHGTVALNATKATISYNGKAGGQLFITAGGNGYAFVLASNTFTQIATLNGEATQGGMVNARFLAFNKTTGKVRESALNDGTTWDPLLFFQRSAQPDPWQAMLIHGSHIFLIGETTGEAWYDSGAFPQPFALIPGSVFPYGTAASFSAAAAGDFLLWLSHEGSIVAARGFTPTRVSNFAVDTAIAGYRRSVGISDCETLVYEDQGHLFAAFSFPKARATWVVDLSQGMLWHERGTWDAMNGRFDVWGPRVYTLAFNQHLVGLRGSAGISRMDVTLGSANGASIRRLRIPPPLWATSRQRLVVSRLQVMAEPGLGLVAGQGSDPQMMARFSDDAKTWSSERMASAGKIGDYRRRITWNRCGSSDSLWVPEITVTDGIPWRISGAEIDGSGFQQQASARAA